MNIEGLIKGACALAGGALVYVFGTWDALMMGLLIMVVMDYATGITNAAVHRRLSSSVGAKGILKKVFIFAIVAMGALLDRVLPGLNGAMRSAVCCFYIANEGISILENAAELGVPVPGAVKQALEKMRQAEGDKRK